MSSLPDFAPSTDTEVREMVRTLTEYDDTDDELPQSKLDSQLQMAKLRLYNELDIDGDEFYDDAGLGQALVASVAIYSKLAVENYSVTRWRIADQEIETSDMTETDSAQMTEWVQMYRNGVRKSKASTSRGPTNTTGYIG